MLNIYPGEQRFLTQIDWLKSRHSFSFSHHYDPRRMVFRSLRVINEDWIAPGSGFPTHPHEDMEILTVVLDGAIAHKDSTGGGSTLRPGQIQRMSAGTGIRHSEFNASETEELHLYQIWLLPERKGLEPGYEEKPIDLSGASKGFVPLANRQGSDGAVTIHQDAALYLARPADDETLAYDFAEGRHGWLQVSRGAAEVDGTVLRAGDAVQISDVARLEVKGRSAAEVLLFDLN